VWGWDTNRQTKRLGNVVHKKLASSNTEGLDFVLSDATVDRYGDIILSDGWELTNFKKNPVALFSHRSDFPIGQWKNLRAGDGALRGTLELAPRGTSDRIDEVTRLIDAGVLCAVSVGFTPIQVSRVRVTNPEQFIFAKNSWSAASSLFLLIPTHCKLQKS
jgi:hypothetical protein